MLVLKPSAKSNCVKLSIPAAAEYSHLEGGVYEELAFAGSALDFFLFLLNLSALAQQVRIGYRSLSLA